MYLALTYDHRLLDGREAVTFLVKVCSGPRPFATPGISRLTEVDQAVHRGPKEDAIGLIDTRLSIFASQKTSAKVIKADQSWPAATLVKHAVA